jgi:putative ABC transport system permease protein
LYGWDWDSALLASNGYGNMDATQTAAILAADDHVASWSGAYFGNDTLDDVDVQLLGMDPDAVVAPPLVEGRMLHEPDEIVLGQGTASDLGRHIGDTVVIGQTGDALRVVGIAILPSIGKAHVAHVSLGSGAIVDPSRVPGLDLDIVGDASDSALGPTAAFVRFTAGTDPTAELARLRQSTAPLAGFAGFDVLPAQRPAEIVHADELGNAPRVLAIGLALAALVSLTLGLFTSVRSRLRDLALLQALGFTRRQLSAAVWWHATVIAVVGTGVGIPLGIVLGRSAWSRFAGRMHVVAEPRVSTLALIAVATGTILIASLVAAWPARSAQQVDAAAALRTG